MSRPIHPLFFAAFPILFLVAHNRDVTSPSQAAVPLAVTLGIVALAQVVLGRLTRAPRKAAVLLSVGLVLFFSYGHAWRVFQTDAGVGAAFIAIAVVCASLTLRTRRPLRDLTRVLNIVAVVLVLTTIVTITEDALRTPPAAAGPTSDLTLRPPERPRDIYYLIFDRYADATTLRDHFGFDNSPFLGSLRDKGFVVTPRSIANYENTHMSLASSMNIDHLDPLMAGVQRPSKDLQPVFDRIGRSEVARLLKGAGYRYIHVGSWAAFTASSPLADVNLPAIDSSEFARTLYGSTALSPLLRNATTDDDITQRDATRGALRKLDEAIDMDGPKFVFTHFILPHPPYVFDRHGNATRGNKRAGNVEGFLEATRYANREIERITSKLLDTEPGRQPIIVIQADEGPYPRLTTTFPKSWTLEPKADVRVKYGILNAYLLPGEEGRGALYDSISPVNTFRVIFNRYFGTDLAMLDDTAYAIVDKHDAYTLAPMPGIADTPPASFVP